MAAREELSFRSGGVSCAAYLYRARTRRKIVPCVVMAHGFSATRDDGLPAYAERFAAAGITALVFDYRHFGASGGEPRQLLSIARQQDDYRAAVGFARGLAGIDPLRVALWGSSFSGGHVVAIAAQDPTIAAVVAQAPFADGLPTLRALPPSNAARMTLAGLRDLAGALGGRPPVLLPAVGPPGTLAAMTAAEAEPGFRSIVPADSRWENAFSARTALTLAAYRPVTVANRLTMPLLVCVCDRDRTTPAGAAVRLGERAPRGEVVHYPAGHFEIYTGETFERAVADQTGFLRRHLGLE